MALSLFGEPLPHEDDTAATLIRRTGYPPEGSYRQIPEHYTCPCCEQFGQDAKHPTIVEEEEAARKRKLMQFDVIEERAKRNPKREDNRHRPFLDNDGLIDDVCAPAPPSTVGLLNEGLKNEWANQHPGAKLIVTVHHGKKISAEQRNQLSVILRCGAFEGQTVRVPRGPAALTKWDELFEFPYPNDTALLEFVVINHALKTKEKTLGGAIVPCDQLHDTKRGIEETVPVMAPSEAGKAVVGTEGPLGTIIVSWFVSLDGSGREVLSSEKQHLSEPLACNFVAHRLFQYTDNGSKVYPGGVLCVLRDPEEQCSESVLYLPLPEKEPSLSKFYNRTGYHYLPENYSQIMQMQTGRKVGHILICIPNQKTGNRRGTSSGNAEEELLVVGAVPLDFELLHHRGSAVLLIESKSKDDALWGEITIEWANKSLLEEKKDLPVISKKEALVVTVVRGLNLVRADDQPVVTASVEVATRDMAGSTVYAPNVADGNSESVVTWNQEIRFIGVRSDEKHLEVKIFENGFPVGVGKCKLSNDDKGVVIVPVYDLATKKKKLGELVLSYARIHKDQDATKMGAPLTNDTLIDGYGNGKDEEDEEDEEKETKPKKIIKTKKGSKTSTEPGKKRTADGKKRVVDRQPSDDDTDIVDVSRVSSHHTNHVESRESSPHTNPDESRESSSHSNHVGSRESSHHTNPDGSRESSSHSNHSGSRNPRKKSIIDSKNDENVNSVNSFDASRNGKNAKEDRENQKMIKKLIKEITDQEKEKRKEIQKDEHDERKELKDDMKNSKRNITRFVDDTTDDETESNNTDTSRSKTKSSKESRTSRSRTKSTSSKPLIDVDETDSNVTSALTDDDKTDLTSRSGDSDTSSTSSTGSDESSSFSDTSSSSDDSSARRRRRRNILRSKRKLDQEKGRKKPSKTPVKKLTKKKPSESPEQSPPAYDRKSMSRKPAVPRAADALRRPNYWLKKEDGFKDPFFPPGSSGAKELHADYDHSSIGQAQEEAIRRIHDELNRHTSLLSSAQRARSSVRRSRSPSESPKREKSSDMP